MWPTLFRSLDRYSLAVALTSSRWHSLRLFSLLAACAAVMLVAGFAVMRSLAPTSGSWTDQASVDEPRAVPPAATQPFRFRTDIAPEQAARINSAIPASVEPVIPAKPFAILSLAQSSRDQMSAVDCLTAAIYYEAASETYTGQRAVAQVILNRVRHPAYPNSVCEVVFQGASRRTGCQFTFTCDGALTRQPTAYGWSRARSVAVAALSGSVEASVGLATHYHTRWVVPYWSGGLTKLGAVGAHIFYRWNGYNGTQRAFSSRYSASEVLPGYAARHLTGYFLAPTDPRLAVEDLSVIDDSLGRPGRPVAAGAPPLQPRGELSSAAPSSVAVAGGQLRQPDSVMKGQDEPKLLIADQGKLIDQP